MVKILTYFDILLTPIYLVLILFICSRIKSNNIALFPEYKYFTKGIFFKLLGVSAFISIYLFYYGGGDTVNYFRGAKAVGNLLIEDFEKGIAVLFNTTNEYNNFLASTKTPGSPPITCGEMNPLFLCLDIQHFFVYLGQKFYNY